MSDFQRAGVSFTDDDNPSAPPRPALFHHPDLTVADARRLLGDADWPAYTIDGYPGVWITPKGNIPVSEFCEVTFRLGDGWLLQADPR